MSPYVSLLGKYVEVTYRAFGTVHLLSAGILIDFSDEHIVIEQHRDGYGAVEPFELLIKYSWIVDFRENSIRTCFL